MPQVKYTKEKGIVQSSGKGWVMGTEAITLAGALDPGVPVSLVTAATNAIALTLADGDVEGQLKWVVSLHANEATVAPATTAGAYANFVLTNIGDTASLQWTASGWALLARCSGATAAHNAVAGLPVVA
jgi:DNA-binding IclR family transcriptional regulator